MSVIAESVGRCSRLCVEIEVAGKCPHLHAVAVHSYGQVALEHHSVLSGVVGGSLQLQVQQILHIAVEITVVRTTAGITFGAVVGIVVNPIFVIF